MLDDSKDDSNDGVDTEAELARRQAIRVFQGRMQEEGVLLGQLTPEDADERSDDEEGVTETPTACTCCC